MRRFEEIKNILCEILLNLEKYCVSFFQGKEDPYLETAYSYEYKRKELSESIRSHVDRITDIIVTYRKGGLTLKMLGMHANDLARKCDCYDAPILFIFAEVKFLHSCSGYCTSTCMRSQQRPICIFFLIYLEHVWKNVNSWVVKVFVAT